MPRLKTGFMVNDLTESGPHKGIHLRKLTPRDAEWTPDGLLRHVVYLGKRENTPAIEVASQHAPCRGDLITVMLPPSIVVDDIGERDTANRPIG
jgi:hypothetical protein